MWVARASKRFRIQELGVWPSSWEVWQNYKLQQLGTGLGILEGRIMNWSEIQREVSGDS
jgi:hypothetical protein